MSGSQESLSSTDVADSVMEQHESVDMLTAYLTRVATARSQSRPVLKHSSSSSSSLTLYSAEGSPSPDSATAKAVNAPCASTRRNRVTFMEPGNCPLPPSTRSQDQHPLPSILRDASRVTEARNIDYDDGQVPKNHKVANNRRGNAPAVKSRGIENEDFGLRSRRFRTPSRSFPAASYTRSVLSCSDIRVTNNGMCKESESSPTTVGVLKRTKALSPPEFWLASRKFRPSLTDGGPSNDDDDDDVDDVDDVDDDEDGNEDGNEDVNEDDSVSSNNSDDDVEGITDSGRTCDHSDIAFQETMRPTVATQKHVPPGQSFSPAAPSFPKSPRLTRTSFKPTSSTWTTRSCPDIGSPAFET